MQSFEQLKDTPEYQTWLTGDNDVNIPSNGESGLQMKMRVLNAFSEIKEDTCIITHGGVTAAIMEHLFPDEGKNRYEWQPKNGCGYVICDIGTMRFRDKFYIGRTLSAFFRKCPF